MRIAVLSDLHSNLEALEAVLADLAAQGGVDQTWCLGDIVGYGPDPAETLEFVRARVDVAIAGNHDYAVAGVIDTSEFNPYAAAAARWTAQRLSEQQRRFLKELPAKVEASATFTLAHGSPRQPIWEYLLSTAVAQANLSAFNTAYCLVGHSHVPLLFAFPEAPQGDSPPAIQARLLEPGEVVTLAPGRLILNPGSVGQPRDGDPRAAYALLDTEGLDTASGTWVQRRVSYDFRRTQDKMRLAGLPAYLGQRLASGR